MVDWRPQDTGWISVSPQVSQAPGTIPPTTPEATSHLRPAPTPVEKACGAETMPSAAQESHIEPQMVAGDPVPFRVPLTSPSYPTSSLPSSWPCKPQLRKIPPHVFKVYLGPLFCPLPDGVRPWEVGTGLPAPRVQNPPQMSGQKGMTRQPPSVSLSSKVLVKKGNAMCFPFSPFLKTYTLRNEKVFSTHPSDLTLWHLHSLVPSFPLTIPASLPQPCPSARTPYLGQRSHCLSPSETSQT